MGVRISKLAKQLERSEDEVMAAVTSLGLPYSSPDQQLSDAARLELTRALAARRFAVAPRPATARPAKVDPLDAELNRRYKYEPDPLEGTWMNIALADASGLAAALHKDKVERKRPAAAPAPRYDEDDEPLPTGRAVRPPPAAPRPAPRQASTPEEVLKALGFAGVAARKVVSNHLPREETLLLAQSSFKVATADRLKAAITAAISRSCGKPACEAGLKKLSKPVVLISDARQCDFCHGSNTQASATQLVALLKGLGISRLLVVGGSPASHEELRSLFPPEIKLRLISGDSRVTGKEARDHMEWADAAVLWAPTILDHKVSELYKGRRTGTGRRMVFVEHRSVELLAEGLARNLAVPAVDRG